MGEDTISKKKSRSKVTRAKKGLPQGHKGRVSGSMLWKAFCAIRRSLDCIWKAAKRIDARKRHEFYYFEKQYHSQYRRYIKIQAIG